MFDDPLPCGQCRDSVAFTGSLRGNVRERHELWQLAAYGAHCRVHRRRWLSRAAAPVRWVLRRTGATSWPSRDISAVRAAVGRRGCLPSVGSTNGTVRRAVATRDFREDGVAAVPDAAEGANALGLVGVAPVGVFDAAGPVEFARAARHERGVDGTAVGHLSGVPARTIFRKRVAVFESELQRLPSCGGRQLNVLGRLAVLMLVLSGFCRSCRGCLRFRWKQVQSARQGLSGWRPLGHSKRRCGASRRGAASGENPKL